MPVTVSYPGVYVEEIPSGNFTITGVATSITAFVGRTLMGPTEPMDVFSYAEFLQHFGGRSYNFPLSYAVEDFFQNGGGHAIIVRVIPSTDKDNKEVKLDDVTAKSSNASLPLIAASPGAWGNGLTASIDRNNISPQVAEQYERYGLGNADKNKSAKQLAAVAASKRIAADSALRTPGSDANQQAQAVKQAKDDAKTAVDAARKAENEAADAAKSDLFNLTLTYTDSNGQQTVQRYPNLTLKDAPNRIDRVLNAAPSRLAVVPKDQITNLTTLAATPLQETQTPIGFDHGMDPDGHLGSDDYVGDAAVLNRTGIYALDHIDLFNILCIPWDQRGTDVPLPVYQAAADYCARRRAMLILDPPQAWADHANAGYFNQIQPTDLEISGATVPGRNCAVYFPRVKKADPEMGGFVDVFPACGLIAGAMAATDVSRGVWKAPAGISVGLAGIDGLEVNLTDEQNGMLNQLGINCLRNFPIIGPIVWGARTLRGADMLSDDYKYVPVRRLTLFIEESLYRGSKFAVFEPNAEPLWAQLRLAVGAFMADLARQGAFYQWAVACDKTTTTQYDIDRGIVNIRVAFAPVKPAEFVVLQIQQLAGQSAAAAA